MLFTVVDVALPLYASWEYGRKKLEVDVAISFVKAFL